MLNCLTQVESNKALDAVDGFTIESLYKQGFTAVFLGIGKRYSSRMFLHCYCNVQPEPEQILREYEVCYISDVLFCVVLF